MIQRAASATEDALLRLAPEPTPSLQIDPNSVTPGPAGFIAIFLIGLVVVLLVIDMVRRVRRVNYRAEIQERLQTEKREQDAALEASEERDDRPDTRRNDSP
ncbi:hypothetical protein GCM10027416_10770 [Okibacterium endophyticum]